METLKHPTFTVVWVAQHCRNWLNPGKGTQIFYGGNPNGTVQFYQRGTWTNIIKTDYFDKINTKSFLKAIILRFHDNCGKKIQLSNNHQTAQRTSRDTGHGVVISRDPMLTNLLYEVGYKHLCVCVSVRLVEGWAFHVVWLSSMSMLLFFSGSYFDITTCMQ